MYAIVEIAGQQFKIEKEQEIFVHRLADDIGSSVEFDQVLLFENAGSVTVGTPTVDGVMVKAKILEHMRGDKVRVFHKKRRKGYQKENGHRQYFSKVVIEDILTGVKKAEKKVAEKVEAPKAKTAPKAKAEAKTEAKAETKAPAKKAAPKAAAKKAAAPKKKAAAPKAEKKAAAPKAKKAEPKADDTKE